MSSKMHRQILEGIRKAEDSELQMYATEPSGSMSEAGDSAFKKWQSQLNSLVAAKLGVGLGDIEDMPYRDWFDSGMTPEEAKDEVMDNLRDEYGEFGGIFDSVKEGAVRYEKRKATTPEDFKRYSRGTKWSWQNMPDYIAKGYDITFVLPIGGPGEKYAILTEPDGTQRAFSSNDSDIPLEQVPVTEDKGGVDEGCGTPGKKAKKAAGKSYSKTKEPEAFWGTAQKVQKNIDASEAEELPMTKGSSKKHDPFKASTNLPSPRDHLKGKDAPVKEEDGWMSLEDVETECSECAGRMREAGFTRIRRSMLDECKKPYQG